ncbi:MAG: hypothetical protein H6871_10190 [Methylobacteriaceae bacterium]|nr:hypothetical protein [Methylobacteriaceae bacterium]
MIGLLRFFAALDVVESLDDRRTITQRLRRRPLRRAAARRQNFSRVVRPWHADLALTESKQLMSGRHMIAQRRTAS